MKKFKKYVSIAVLGSTLLTVACPAMVEATENSGLRIVGIIISKVIM